MVPHADRPQPPADQGLSSLGLIMTLVGSVMAPLVGALLLGQIRVAAARETALSGMGGSNDSVTLWLFLIMIAGVVRSLVHRMAGLRLWRDAPTDPPSLSGLTTYLIASAAHTGLVVLFLKVHDDTSMGALLGTAVLMMAWPAAIYGITRMRRFQALAPRIPLAEDNGFEGLAVLMAIFGFIGLVCSVVFTILGFSLRDEASGTANLFMLVGVALTVRSIIHLNVGARAVRGTAVNAASDFVRYGDVGVVIGAVVGAVLTLWLFMESLDFFAMAFGVAVMLGLIAWPTIVRRFVIWRHLADVATDTVRRRSPDAGITALGWLLLGGAAIALGSYVAATLWESGIRARSATMVMYAASIPLDENSRDWWTLPLGLAQLWAALELLAVTPRRRAVASLWALAALLATAIEWLPDLPDLAKLPLEQRAMGYAIFLLILTPAVATLLLVNRAQVPIATARIKS